MGRYVIFAVTAALAAFFTVIGIYAWNRKKPMWFWSGTSVSETEISDVPAYNRANGIMWIVFSAIFWIAAIVAFVRDDVVAPLIMAFGLVFGIPALAVTYEKIRAKYHKDPRS